MHLGVGETFGVGGIRTHARKHVPATMLQSLLTFALLEDVLSRRVAKEELLVEIPMGSDLYGS